MILLLPILLPIALSVVILSGAIHRAACIRRFAVCSVVLSSAAAFTALALAPEGGVTLIAFTDKLTFALRADGLSRLFGGMVALLWIPTTFYALEYMEHAGGERRFYGFFLMSMGVVLGVALAGNLFTLYLFYEYLTFSTLPLVMHDMDDKARFAGRRYLTYMILGGALAFVALLFMVNYGVSLEFTWGGTLDAGAVAGRENLLRAAFLVSLAGFGVKAAIFPLHRWLPGASVAPTPVTALLHAVAVVKSGVFAIIRVIFYSFGAALLAGSFAQNVMMALAIVTILFGSVMALRTPHLKRRLAYSTVSNLSYILFGASLMTGAGLSGALMHMLYHASIKITLFFCAGAILHKTGVEYLDDIKGFGRRMPLTMACFTVSALCLIGVPPLGAFFSKWYMAVEAAGVAAPLAVAGMAALVISELLTALYMFGPIIYAYFLPAQEAQVKRSDGGALMSVPIVALTVLSVALSFGAGWLNTLLSALIG